MSNYIRLYAEKYYYLEDNIQRHYINNIEEINGQWCVNGKLIHREEGPAIEWSNGDKYYYQYGKRHRIGGPAVEFVNGYKEYWENGKRHREDGPAIKYSDGRKEYWLCDRKFKTKEDMIHYRDYLMIME